MEGKGCLFKKFAGIDVFDIELAEGDPEQARRHDRRPRADARGVNLEEQSRRPSASTSSRSCASAWKIPVFHDDSTARRSSLAAALA